MDLTRIHSIEIIFDKMFCKITHNADKIYSTPFLDILNQTFHNRSVITAISELSFQSSKLIEEYLSSDIFKRIYLRTKIKSLISIAILFGEDIEGLVAQKCLISFDQLILAVLNDRLTHFQYLWDLIEVSQSQRGELLSLSTEYSSQIYFWLRSKDIVPNIFAYNRAVQTESIDIIKDINESIAPSKKTVQQAFQSNHTEVIKYVMSECKNDDVTIDKELLSYPIMNGNIDLLTYLRESDLWPKKIDPNLYYSALLSGSMAMIRYVEEIFPDIHENYFLDSSKIKRGQGSLLLNEMIYFRDSKKYFSHTMTYAIQSGSIEIVKYVHSLNYGITQSNLVNAIRGGSIDIVRYIVQFVQRPVPDYLIYYLSFQSYLSNKKVIAKILLDNQLLCSQNQLSINDYKLQTAHLKLITDRKKIIVDLDYDTDYLMSYDALVVPLSGYKMNMKLITFFRFLLETNGDYESVLSSKISQLDRQYLTDIAFLFGKNHQIKKVLSYNRQIPSSQIVIEVLCYERIDKINLLLDFFKSSLSENVVDMIYQVCHTINNHHTTDLIATIRYYYPTLTLSPSIDTLIQSRQIGQLIDRMKDSDSMASLSSDQLKDLLVLGEDHCELFDFLRNNLVKNNLAELLKWVRHNDLIKMTRVLEDDTI